MRVLFTIWPGGAHLQPIASLAYALRGAGHEVVVASHPFFVDAITEVGLTAVSLGHPGNMPIPKGPGRPHAFGRSQLKALDDKLNLTGADAYNWFVFSMFLMPAVWDFQPIAPGSQPNAGVDELVDFAKHWQPDLVLWDACFPAGAVAAAASGAAHARLCIGPDTFAWVTELFADLNAKGVNVGPDPLTVAMTPVAERHGVEVDNDILVGNWTLDLSPAAMAIPVKTRNMPMRWVPFTGASVLPEWLRRPSERGSRLALSLGVSNRAFFSPEAEVQTRSLLDAVADLDVEVVATLNDAQLSRLGEIPSNVRTIDYVPLTELLPSCQAIIHHGGIGSFTAAASAKVPQLVTDTEGAVGPFFVEEDGEVWSMEAGGHVSSPWTSKYVNDAGAGLTLNYQRLSAEEMSKRVHQVLTEPSYAAGAERIYRDLQVAPTPADAIPHLERLTKEFRTRPAG